MNYHRILFFPPQVVYTGHSVRQNTTIAFSVQEVIMANSTDQRVMLTKKILKDALLSLMEEKSINKITPT